MGSVKEGPGPPLRTGRSPLALATGHSSRRRMAGWRAGRARRPCIEGAPLIKIKKETVEIWCG